MNGIKNLIAKFQSDIESAEQIQLPPFYFNTNQLPDFNNYKINIREDRHFEKLFVDLDNVRGYCLYWFEIKSSEEAMRLKYLLNEKRSCLWDRKSDKRKVPVNNFNDNKTTLYVGVRQGGVRKKDGLTNISGRIIQHLGYYDKGSTQGLQLVHWAKGTNIEISINVINFKNIQKEYLYILEKLFALELKPLCGRH